MRHPLSLALLALLLLAACSSPPPDRVTYPNRYPPDSQTHRVTPYP